MARTIDERSAIPANEEAIGAWDGVLFDRFVRFRPIVTAGLGAHGEAALGRFPPAPGERVLDLGCGFGDTTVRIAEQVGPTGEAVGIDAAARFVEAAEAEARAGGPANARFAVADVEAGGLGSGYHRAFSRFGTMFFANPVAALRHVRRALVPGGQLCMVVWRRKLDNDWVHRAETIVNRFLTRPDETDELTCGPGPFSMANADTTSDILLAAGFEDVAFHRHDIPIRIGRDMEEAVAYNLAIGPAAELFRLCGDEAERIRPQIEAALRAGLDEFDAPDGVRAPASTWTVTARRPTSWDGGPA